MSLSVPEKNTEFHGSNYTFDFTAAEIELIMAVLGKAPAEISRNLMNKIDFLSSQQVSGGKP